MSTASAAKQVKCLINTTIFLKSLGSLSFATLSLTLPSKEGEEAQKQQIERARDLLTGFWRTTEEQKEHRKEAMDLLLTSHVFHTGCIWIAKLEGEYHSIISCSLPLTDEEHVVLMQHLHPELKRAAIAATQA